MIPNEKKQLLKLLDTATITALLRLYHIPLKVVAVRFRCTKSNVVYLLQNDKLKPYQCEMLLDMFMAYGLDATSLALVHHMVNRKEDGEGA